MASAAEQLAANINFGAFGRATELKKRLWFTLGALIVYRLGTYIPLPGIDPNQKNLTAGSYAKYGNGGGVETYALARVERLGICPRCCTICCAGTERRVGTSEFSYS